MKNVRIEISAAQNGKEVSYLYTHGVMHRSHEGDVSLEFNGFSLTGETTSLPVFVRVGSNGKLTFSSGKGKGASTFVFERGVRRHCHISLDDSCAIVGVDARRMATDLDSHGGSIDLEYSLNFNCIPPVINTMHISVREDEPDPNGLDGWFSRHSSLLS